MEEHPRPPTAEDFRNRLAAERTLLAWIRTGVTLMGLGFMVARFGVALREVRLSPSTGSAPHSAISTWIGISLVIVGSIMMGAAAWEHRLYLRRLDRQESHVPNSWLSDTGAAVLTAIGIGVATYLLLTGL